MFSHSFHHSFLLFLQLSRCALSQGLKISVSLYLHNSPYYSTFNVISLKRPPMNDCSEWSIIAPLLYSYTVLFFFMAWFTSYHHTCLIITSLTPTLECKLHQGKDLAVFTSVSQTRIPPDTVGTHSIFVKLLNK